jgi:hypothetical protein
MSSTQNTNPLIEPEPEPEPITAESGRDMARLDPSLRRADAQVDATEHCMERMIEKFRACSADPPGRMKAMEGVIALVNLEDKAAVSANQSEALAAGAVSMFAKLLNTDIEDAERMLVFKTLGELAFGDRSVAEALTRSSAVAAAVAALTPTASTSKHLMIMKAEDPSLQRQWAAHTLNNSIAFTRGDQEIDRRLIELNVPQTVARILGAVRDAKNEGMDVTSDEFHTTLITFVLNVVGNAGFHPLMCPVLVDAGAVSALEVIVELKEQSWPSDAAITLACLVGKEEGLELPAGFDALVTAFKCALQGEPFPGTQKYYKTWKVATAVDCLCIADANKENLVKAGAISLLAIALQHTMVDKPDQELDDLQKCATSAVEQLALSDISKSDVSANSDVMDCLRAVSTSERNKSAKRSAEQALFTLEAVSKRVVKVAQKRDGSPERDGSVAQGADQKHTMISYNWGHQALVKRIAASLKSNGIKIWIDIDDMSGSTLEAMAEAVDNSSCALVCISKAYKESANCRLEGQYISALQVPWIPLMMEEGRPNGWLGLMLGSKLYYQFYGPVVEDEAAYSQKFGEMLRELKNKIGDDSPSPSSPPTTTTVASAPATAPPPAAAVVAPAAVAPAPAAAPVASLSLGGLTATLKRIETLESSGHLSNEQVFAIADILTDAPLSEAVRLDALHSSDRLFARQLLRKFCQAPAEPQRRLGVSEIGSQLREMKDLVDENLISEADYEQVKTKLLAGYRGGGTEEGVPPA